MESGVIETVAKIFFVIVMLYIVCCLIAQQIIDVHYARTGETWQEKIKRDEERVKKESGKGKHVPARRTGKDTGRKGAGR